MIMMILRKSLRKLLEMMTLKSGNLKMTSLQTRMMMLKFGNQMKVSPRKIMQKSGKMIRIIQMRKNQNQLKIK